MRAVQSLKALTCSSIIPDRRRRFALLFVAGAYSFLCGRLLLAQGCCTAGASSLGTFDGGMQTYRTLAVTLNYQFTSLTSTYRGHDRIADPLSRTADVGYLTLAAEYGLQPDLSLAASLNYSGKNREITVQSGAAGNRFPETASFSGSGFGDILLLAKYRIIRSSISQPVELSIGGGARVPTGSFTDEQNGARLSIDLQPGTGAVDVLAWLFVMKAIPESGFRFYTSWLYKYAGTNFDSYRIGDEIVGSIGGVYTLTGNFSGSLALRSRFAWQDYANRRVLLATGGTYHDILPAILYGEGSVAVRLFAQFPLYRNVRGIQLTPTHMLGLELMYTMDFRTPFDLLDRLREEIE